ncbi:MAG: FtsQ-type POTRA domain-containing protein, partial [Pseudomonadota bacterium]
PVVSVGANGILSGSGIVASRLMRRGIRKAQSALNLKAYSKRSMFVAGFAVVTAGGLGVMLLDKSAENPATASAFMSDVGFSTRALIVNGNSAIDNKGIEFSLASQLQSSIFTFDANQARETLLENPWFKSASVRKVYPDTVVVDVVERQPFAFWKASNAVTVIARDGVVLGEASPEHLKLPQVVGQGANLRASEFISVIARFPSIAERASGFVRVAKRRWDIVFRNGPKVMLPEHDWKEALAELDAMQKQKGILDRELVHIDMRLPDRFVLRLEEDAAQERREYLEKLLKRSWHRT